MRLPSRGRRSPALPRTPSRVRKEWKEGVAPDLEVLCFYLVAFRNRKGRLTERSECGARSRSELGSEIFTHTLAPGGIRPIRPKRAAMIVRALPLRSRARRSERVGFRSRIITCPRAPEAVRGRRHDSGSSAFPRGKVSARTCCRPWQLPATPTLSSASSFSAARVLLQRAPCGAT